MDETKGGAQSSPQATDDRQLLLPASIVLEAFTATAETIAWLQSLHPTPSRQRRIEKLRDTNSALGLWLLKVIQ